MFKISNLVPGEIPSLFTYPSLVPHLCTVHTVPQWCSIAVYNYGRSHIYVCVSWYPFISVKFNVCAPWSGSVCPCFLVRFLSYLIFPSWWDKSLFTLEMLDSCVSLWDSLLYLGTPWWDLHLCTLVGSLSVHVGGTHICVIFQGLHKHICVHWRGSKPKYLSEVPCNVNEPWWSPISVWIGEDLYPCTLLRFYICVPW